jgi:hypothetical protein
VPQLFAFVVGCGCSVEAGEERLDQDRRAARDDSGQQQR